MTATGIGAPVRRKEDQRFITGKGHYTDDHARPDQVCAHFVRSPHAHAKLKKIDTAAASTMPGVIAIYTGEDFATDKLGRLICGWMVHSKDGSPMKMAPHPALAAGKVSHVGDAYAVVIAETAGAGQGRGREGRHRFRSAAGGDRSGAGAEQGRAADPRGRARQHHLRLAYRRSGRERRGDEEGQARHPARLHQQSPGAECARAALGDRRIRSGRREFHALDHEPESACGAARDLGLRRRRARAQAAGDRAGCRRRLRLEDIHLSGRGRLPVGRRRRWRVR